MHALHCIALSFLYNNSIRMPDDFIRTYVTVPATFYPCMYSVCTEYRQAFLACFMKSDTCIPFNAIPSGFGRGHGYTRWYGTEYMVCIQTRKETRKRKIQ